MDKQIERQRRARLGISYRFPCLREGCKNVIEDFTDDPPAYCADHA